jgi:hypothetical protein
MRVFSSPSERPVIFDNSGGSTKASEIAKTEQSQITH